MPKERVFKIISQLMNVPLDQVHEHSSPETIAKWDSFQHMNLILALEEEFNIKFGDEEIMQMGNAGVIVKSLQSKGVRD
ncbi:MAG TPA: acyl carrier protein [bacterium]|nr:acyl carrier protein [bacterium]